MIPENLENQLKNIDPKTLFETWDGKLFNVVRDNWMQISDDSVKIFKSKLQQLYPDNYSAQPLKPTILGGKKCFETDNVQFFFWE